MAIRHSNRRSLSANTDARVPGIAISHLPIDIDGVTEVEVVAVFRKDGRIVGRLETQSWDDEDPSVCAVVVAEPFRGRGIAKAMLRYLIGLAREKTNLFTLRIEHCVDNTAARRAYEAVGFQVVRDGTPDDSESRVELKIGIRRDSGRLVIPHSTYSATRRAEARG